MATQTSRGTSIRRCTTADTEAMAALGARLFAETYGPTHPEPELSRYLARAFAAEGGAEAAFGASANDKSCGFGHVRSPIVRAAGRR